MNKVDRLNWDRPFSRRGLLRAFAVGAGALAVGSGLGGKAYAKNAKRPNVVLIMADDMGFECLGCNGGVSYKTPNLDKLASDGMRFEHCYSTPLCTPSRVQIMTGKYNFRNYESFGYLNPKEITFAHIMKDAGYSTMIAGKWQLNGLTYQFPRYDDNTRPNDTGFDKYILWQLTQPKSKGERFWDPRIEQNGKMLYEELKGKYGPDILCDYVCNFIERKKDVPFLVYYPMVLTHDPFVPTPDTIDRKQSKQDNFADMVAYADKNVGRIRNKLEQEGLLENTLLIFIADNGTHVSLKTETRTGTVKGGKGTPPDAGTRVPMIAYWKGHTPKGVVSEDLIDFTDFLPTLAEAAGAKLPKDEPFDGRSFLPQLQGKKGNPREWIFCHYDPMWGSFSNRKTRFARTQRFKLYHDGKFYDIPVDVLEQKDLDLSEGGEIDLKKSVREKLQALLDSKPPWVPGTKPERPKKK